MSTPTRTCNSIDAIKSIAKKLKKGSKNPKLKHFDYLNKAAQLEAFDNFNHASNYFESQQVSDPWVRVRCRFLWRDTANRDLVGHLQVDVTPLRGLSQEDLQRIVFVLPEFWTVTDAVAHEHEHFRIDSAYFHRVTSAAHAVYSKRLPQKNVMSFHLVNCRWQASIFDYNTKLSQADMALEIERRLIGQFNDCVSLYQQDKLDSSKVLPLELYEEMIAAYGPTEQNSVLFARND
ncbi:hypothetical protein BV326_05593 [Pseudomonas syringae pv. actinidiae]|uniref:hypothetical protein n=1 Tax=Pseudomonas syringae TaxID=317 RepID=UPI000A255EB0|nr:hypothetical protein [Pseudomonas syringae]OSR64773.1 hypothetical protein BV326_05593 [Pseudomonas syringae pv. actinidiae]